VFLLAGGLFQRQDLVINAISFKIQSATLIMFGGLRGGLLTINLAFLAFMNITLKFNGPNTH